MSPARQRAISFVAREVQLRGSQRAVRLITVPHDALAGPDAIEGEPYSDNGEPTAPSVDWLKSIGCTLRRLSEPSQTQVRAIVGLVADETGQSGAYDLDALIAGLPTTRRLSARTSAEAQALTNELFVHSYVPLPRSPALRTLSLSSLLAYPGIAVWVGIDPLEMLTLVVVGSGFTLIVAAVRGVAGGLEEGLHERVADFVRKVGRDQQPPELPPARYVLDEPPEGPADHEHTRLPAPTDDKPTH